MLYTMKQLTDAFSITPPTVYEFIKKQDPTFIKEHRVKDSKSIKYDDVFYEKLKEKYGSSALDPEHTPVIVPPTQDKDKAKIEELTAQIDALKKEKENQEKVLLEKRISELEEQVKALQEEKRQLQQQNGELLYILRTKEEKEVLRLQPTEEERKEKKGLFGWFHRNKE